MQYSSINFFSLTPAFLFWNLGLILLSHHATASSLNHPYSPPQLPFQIPQQVSQFPYDSNAKSWLSRARDCLIHTIWRIPSDTHLDKANGKTSVPAGPPPTLLARYGGDLVLRFNIKSIYEAEALAQAIDVLFLDVWEFTTDWVDIRLSKDVVSSNFRANTSRS